MNISIFVRSSLALVLSLSVPLVSSGAFQAAPATAVFVRADTTTQGNWQGVYGSEGSLVINDILISPAYVAGVNNVGGNPFTWDGNPSAVSALQRNSGPGRIAACLFNSFGFSLVVNHSDALPHQVAFYLLDYDTPIRITDVRLFDANTSALLSYHRISSFTRGIYLVWTISGSVRIELTPLNGNAVLSGVFWDPPAPPPMTAGDLRSAVQGTAALSSSQRTLLTQTLDSATARIHLGQYPQAVSLLRSFQSYVTRFSPPLSPATVATLNGAATGLINATSGLSTGLQAYWKLDGNGLDSSGLARHGTFSGNTAPLNPGRIGSAMTFNGGMLNAPSMSWPAGGPASVSFWNFAFTPSFGQLSAFGVGVDGGQRFQAHVPWSDLTLYWDYGNLGIFQGRSTFPYASYLNRWTHVTLVSGGAGGTITAIYLDGIPVSLKSESTAPVIPLNGATVGAWLNNFHQGHLDDFRIYNRVLSPAEVRMLADRP